MKLSILFLSAGLLLPGIRSLAQEPGHRTYIKLNPTTLVNELDVYLEQELNTNTSVEIGAGGIYTDYWDYWLNQTDFGQIKPNLSRYQYANGRGVAGRLGLRYYVISPYKNDATGRGTYFEPMILYKQIWYPSDKQTINGKDYADRGYKYIMGLQLLIGRERQHGKFVIDKYIGLGVKAKTYRFTNYVSNSSGGVDRSSTRTTNWLPSIQLGIKIGMGLQKHGR